MDNKFTELELKAMNYLEVTDSMQFEDWELLAMFAEAYHQEKMKQHDALVKMMAQDEKDGNYEEKGNTPCLHCDGWGYIVDEKGRRKEHCLHCY